jgi:hypothetical protein
LWKSADDVARKGLDDVIAGKALSVPGIAYKSLVAAAGVAPRGLVRRLAGRARRGARSAQE